MIRIGVVLLGLFLSCASALAQTPQLVRECIGTAANCAPVSSTNPVPVTSGSGTFGAVEITDGTNNAAVKAASTNAASTDTAVVADPRPGSAATLSGTITNPSSTLTMTSATTGYSAGQLIATSATAGSITNPSFSISNSAGGAVIPRLRISTNDTTSTAWGFAQIQVDFWTSTPTWTNGDRGTWLPATGAGFHYAAYVCSLNGVWGDGVEGECTPSAGLPAIKLGSGSTLYWSLQTVAPSGVTGASKVWTHVPEIWN